MESSKIFTIFAGVNGAGKSTLYHTLGAECFGVRLNSDEIVKADGQDWRNIRAQVNAARKLIEQQEYCFKNGISFNRETTLSGCNIMKTIEDAKKYNFSINLIYVGVEDLNIAKKRIEKRVSMGGHGIDDESLKMRYKNMSKNILKVLPYCDNVQFFDNSENGFNLVGFKLDNSILKTANFEHNKCKWFNKILETIELEQEMQ